MKNQSALALGLMSGTSADGITAAVIEINNHSSTNFPVRCLMHKTYPYTTKIRQRVLRAIDSKTPEISRLNFELGFLFADAAHDLLKSFRRKNPGYQVQIIGSHGQTIYHGSNDKPANTLQIGEGSVIAERTGLPVVFNFRPRDIAAGGQGAPLVPFFDWYCFKHLSPLILLNIGGIANVTLVNKNPNNIIAFDTGPGNCLMDLTMAKISAGRQHWDQNGRLAAQGTIDFACVKAALRHPYFRQRPPKATGRELFNAQLINRYFGRIKKPNDLLATLTAFTAETISFGVNKYLLKNQRHASSAPHRIIVSGGGTENLFLMKLLRNSLLPNHVSVSDETGLPSQSKEAAAFALFSYLAFRKEPNHLPSSTGAQGKPRILGQIIYP